MNLKFLTPLIIAATATPLLADDDLRLKDCPKPVRETINRNLKGGWIDGIERKRVNGNLRYVVDIDGPGLADRTLHLTAAGRVKFRSEDLSLAQCPPAVRTAINNLLESNWRIDDIDRETTSAGVRFRVDFDRTGERDLEFVLSKNGKVLERRTERNDD